MRALVLAPFPPWSPAAAENVRICHWLRALARRFEVELVGLVEAGVASPRYETAAASLAAELGVDLSLFEGRTAMSSAAAEGPEIRFRSVEMERHVAERAPEVELVVADHLPMAFAAARAVPPGRKPVMALDLTGFEQALAPSMTRPAPTPGSPVVERFYQRWDAITPAREEIAIAQRFDVIAVPSERAASTLRAWTPPGRILVLPDGVDTARFEGGATPRESSDLLFFGAADELPDEQGVRWFHAEVLPLIEDARPGTTVAVVGGRPGPALRALDRPSFRVHGRTDALDGWLAAARVCIVPRLSGGGAERRILQAAAAGCPVVSTTLGCEGLGFEDCRELVIADQPERFAAGCLQLLADRDEARRLADRARVTVKARFDWRELGESFAVALERRCVDASRLSSAAW